MTGSYERKQFSGGAAATSLVGTITDSASTFDLDDATGWPDATNPFVIVIDRGLATEEKMLVGGRSSVTLSAVTRGYDETVAVSHSSGAAVEHVIDASTIDQANRLANLATAKGDLIGHDGTNNVRIPATMTNGFSMVVKTAEPAGFAIERPIHVVDDSATPAVGGVPRVWFDQTTGLIRTSDGTDWRTPATAAVFANDAARDVYYGATPTQDGLLCIVGTGAGLELQAWDGTKWIQFPTIYEGIPKFADATARDAFFTSPATGDHAFLTGLHQMTEYREDEWILLNRKFDVSDTAPVAPHDGDIWIQPT